MTKASHYARHRWFIYSSTGLLVVLCLAIILAAMLLMRRGYITREGLITGSSMEPILHGPRIRITCVQCSRIQEFAWDTCTSNRPFRCSYCDARDMSPELDLDEIDESDERMIPGQRVSIAPLRMIRAMRASEIRLSQGSRKAGLLESGVRRGDVVVIQDAPDSQKEVKRLVGLPGEHLEIGEGDLFVDGNRVCKSLPQALSQSILVDSWEPASKSGDSRWFEGSKPFQGVLNRVAIVPSEEIPESIPKVEFVTKTGMKLDNQLHLNAHDSHSLIEVSDIGIAMQTTEDSDEWNLEVQLASHDIREQVRIHRKGTRIEIESGEATESEQLTSTPNQPLWMVIAIVDGHLLVGTDRIEWLRRPIAKLPTESGSDSPKHPIFQLILKQGKFSVDQMLVFRDIYYRGINDQTTQEWASNERIVVLGDNVSSSSDSRERWDNRLETKAIKGVVLPPNNPIESLLRQK